MDEDGYGDSSSFEYSCEPVEGYVSLKGDCDDSNPSLQAADNDGDGLSTCNGDCDDTDPETKRRRVYLDADEDGVGSSTSFEYSCEPVEGYVSQKGDCDDADPNIHNLDLDGDGLSTCNGDCDDTDPAIKK